DATVGVVEDPDGVALVQVPQHVSPAVVEVGRRGHAVDQHLQLVRPGVLNYRGHRPDIRQRARCSARSERCHRSAANQSRNHVTQGHVVLLLIATVRTRRGSGTRRWVMLSALNNTWRGTMSI